jgi:outer membrane protein OmpA-like peptidoglycan-associated protein
MDIELILRKIVNPKRISINAVLLRFALVACHALFAAGCTGVSHRVAEDQSGIDSIEMTPRPRPDYIGVPKAPARASVTLSTDGLFRSEGFGVGDLTPDGLRRVEQLATEIQRSFAWVQRIDVTSHTDRLDTETRIQAMSQARAAAIRDALVRQGFDGSSIHAVGMGAEKPVKDCAGSRPSAALLRCLRPNRRIEVEINAEPAYATH